MKKYPISNHFDGKRFFNAYPQKNERSLRELLQWLSKRKPPKWPKIPVKQQQLSKEPVPKESLRITFINHSTVLIQTTKYNILTDPIWSERCSPFRWMGPKRKALPGIKFDELPKIDFVLLSHNHYDHFDSPTIKKLHRKYHPEIMVSLGNGKLLKKFGIKKFTEMDWWDTASRPHIKISFVPAQHFSRRGLFDENTALWGGFIIEGEHRTVYFAGDTGFGTHFDLIRKKYGPIGLAMLPIGAFQPRWFMSTVHMSPEDAVKAHQILKASKSIGIHFGTFPLGDEPYESAVNNLIESLEAAGISRQEFLALRNGEGLVF